MNISADISVYTDSSQFMFELGDYKQMDILILDIEMPKMSGFEIADYVKKLGAL
jgi:YesN/AraC family two-component response regulator